MQSVFYCIFHQTSFDDTDQLDWQIFYWIGKDASVSLPSFCL